MSAQKLTFQDYWVLFVRAHASPTVRRVHFATVSAGIGCAVLGVLTRKRTLVVAASALAVLPSWLARKLSSEDTSLLPLHPSFAAVASLKMWHLTLVGAMEDEVDRILVVHGEIPEDEGDRVVPRPNMVTDHTLH